MLAPYMGAFLLTMMEIVMFKKAERKQAKLRLALSGPSGSGKTTGALLIAKGIGGKIAVLDTERGSASLYADLCDFDVVELGPPYTPTSPRTFAPAFRRCSAVGWKWMTSSCSRWRRAGRC